MKIKVFQAPAAESGNLSYPALPAERNDRASGWLPPLAATLAALRELGHGVRRDEIAEDRDSACDLLFVEDAARLDVLPADRRGARLLAGYAEHLPDDVTLLGGFDLILSPDPAVRAAATAAGAGRAEAWFPGAAPYTPARPAAPALDVVFAGRIGKGTAVRSKRLVELAKAPLGLRGEFTIGYALTAPPPPDLAAGIAMHLEDADPMDLLARSRIAIHCREDSDPAGPTRDMLAALAAGAMLLIDQGDWLRGVLEPGTEVATYFGAQGLIDAVYRHLADEEGRRAIAEAGRKALVRRLSPGARAAALDGLLRRL
ncbi:Glycosyl transferases group 1 [Azospirillum oryzae]|uniref:Glycosyl transferases group 1 n=1 Tax=Azospirillum oryzae TaxID=286727 RepID=A0A1X7EXR6_9PROT|nr:glycosyltransferase [Azospirillum oryzae]SMF42186.1 Glycosyl transferases group 1 [Azospirillum oryzae]